MALRTLVRSCGGRDVSRQNTAHADRYRQAGVGGEFVAATTTASARIAAVDGGNQAQPGRCRLHQNPLGRYRFDNSGAPVGASDLIDRQQARPNGAAPRLRFRLRNPQPRNCSKVSATTVGRGANRPLKSSPPGAAVA